MRRFLTHWLQLEEQDLAIAGPFYLFLLLTLAAIYVAMLITTPALHQAGPLILFSVLMGSHAVLHLVSTGLAKRRRWIVLYCLVQGALLFAIVWLTQAGALIIGLYMGLIGEMVGLLWPDRRAVAVAVAFFVLLAAINVVVLWGSAALLQFVLPGAVLLLFVLLYVVLYIRQVQAREETQKLLQELEVAHAQLQEYAARVEELTVSQERQRMARELHDTLAQGLAGLILQLEAADSHLEMGNQGKAHAVVQQAMQRARTTLQEARRAIQALRPAALEQGNLVDALGQEVDRFAATTGVPTRFEVAGSPSTIDPDTAIDVLRIVQEALSNVARHAGASHVLVRLAQHDAALRVEVHDDGVGFEEAARPGCYGLQGMRERAQHLAGHLTVESSRGQGAHITLVVGEEEA